MNFSERFPFSNRLKDKEKVRIKFLSGSISFGGGSFHINPNVWVMKSWYKRHGKNNDKLIWLPVIHNNVGLNEEAIYDMIVTEKPDVICWGLYIWNSALYRKLAHYIRENWPDIIMVGGGPEIYAHKELDLFWEDHKTWLDIAVYGDGEEAFATLIDNIIDAENANQIANNISYLSANVPVIEPYKRFKNAEFNLVSPFLDNAEDVIYAVESAKAFSRKLDIRINWEFTKGCPYACTFCDWSSGLHHKVTRKEYDWKLDLDFLAPFGVEVRWVDANTGMYKDDIKIIAYADELEKKYPGFSLMFANLAKLNKKAVFEIIDLIETLNPGRKLHNLAVQDINEQVLENLDRPDVPWPEYKKYIMDTKAKHPKFRHMIEIIHGLPGQSLRGFSENLLEYLDTTPGSIMSHFWCLLINSPAYNKEYVEKFGLRVEPSLHITDIPEFLESRDEIFENVDEHCQYYAANIVVGNNTASVGDVMAMQLMVIFVNSLRWKFQQVDMKVLSKVLLNTNYWQELGNNIGKVLEEDKKKYGKMLLLPEKDGKPITFESYFDKETIVQTFKQAYKS